jgi:hypothetical protein
MREKRNTTFPVVFFYALKACLPETIVDRSLNSRWWAPGKSSTDAPHYRRSYCGLLSEWEQEAVLARCKIDAFHKP